MRRAEVSTVRTNYGVVEESPRHFLLVQDVELMMIYHLPSKAACL